MRKPWCSLVCLVGVLGVTGLACSKPDPLLGSWRMNHGTTLMFSDGGKVEGHVETVGHKWQGSWTREGERLTIVAPEDPVLKKGTSYSILKINENELVFVGHEAGGTPTGDILSGTRVE